MQIPAHKLGGPGYKSSITTFSHIVISMETQVTVFEIQNSASFPYIFHTSSIFNSAISKLHSLGCSRGLPTRFKGRNYTVLPNQLHSRKALLSPIPQQQNFSNNNVTS
jgi:hypothetical protein